MSVSRTNVCKGVFYFLPHVEKRLAYLEMRFTYSLSGIETIFKLICIEFPHNLREN
jgi:hypothetical protein